MEEEKNSSEWVCAFDALTELEARDAESVLKQARIPVQWRTMMVQGSTTPSHRVFVPAEQEAEAHDALNQWLDSRPKASGTAIPEPQLLMSADSRKTSLIVMLLPVWIFIICFLFWQEVAELSVLPSVLLSLPLPAGAYYVIKAAQRSDTS